MKQHSDESEAARRLSAKGAAKGGRARASVMDSDERSRSAQVAAQARWAKVGKEPLAAAAKDEDGDLAMLLVQKPEPAEKVYSMFSGALELGDGLFIGCHVLNDHRRVFPQREVVQLLSGGRRSGSYLQNIPGFDPESLRDRVIVFSVPAGAPTAYGYEATLLLEVCEAYLDARDAGTLHRTQEAIARKAEIVMRACARVGIIALVDEATGYQVVRAKRALEAKLRAFIADQMGTWVRRFPDDFWLELARLEGIRYSPRNRPLRWGKYVMDFVYDAIDPDVGIKLREINKNPGKGHNHHQWLEEFGQKALNDHLQQVVAVMKLCDTMPEFRRRFERVFSREPYQLEFAGAGMLD